MSFDIQTPIGYRIEFRAGDYCFYRPEDMPADAKYIYGARIVGLFTTRQQGCDRSVAAYYGRYWHQAKHYANGGDRFDPDAAPLYLGPVINDPEIDE